MIIILFSRLSRSGLTQLYALISLVSVLLPMRSLDAPFALFSFCFVQPFFILLTKRCKKMLFAKTIYRI